MWRAFVVSVPASACELAVDALFGLGVAAVEERSGPDDVVELWTHVGDDDDVIAEVIDRLPPQWSWRLEDVDAAAVDSWREHAEPTVITDDLVIVPAWRPDRQVDGGLAIAIDPGAAFGMGDHPTTVLTLRALRALMDADPVPRTVLDVGSGSGVLSIAAALLGAETVVAIDHHQPAVEATIANAQRNGVAGLVDVSGRPLADVHGEFDLVLGNLLAPVLVELAPDLVRVTAASGRLVVSGLLAGRFDHVVAALDPLELVEVHEFDGWVALELTRP